MPPRKILFLCTGNYYRSRFAEILFNARAAALGLPWIADSRALDITAGRNIGPISAHTCAALAARGIPLPQNLRYPCACADCDLASADLVIALKEAEHRPLIERKFPAYASRIAYWHIHDLDRATPEKALRELEAVLNQLLASLRQASHDRQGAA